MNVKRGFLAALVGAIAGLALTVLLMQIFDKFEGRFRSYEYVPPIIGCTSILAATAWATYAPNAKRSFAWTMVIVAAVSLLLIVILGCLFVPPQRTYHDPPENAYPAFAILSLSPGIVAIWLTTTSRS